jgi:hypothetical protein
MRGTENKRQFHKRQIGPALLPVRTVAGGFIWILPVVAPKCGRLYRGLAIRNGRRGRAERSAGCQPATRQIANLRYTFNLVVT